MVRAVARTLLLASGIATVSQCVNGFFFRPPPRPRCSKSNFLLITDIGLPVSRCANCYEGTKYTVAVAAPQWTNNNIQPHVIWKKCGWRNTNVMLKAPGGSEYLARCENCYPNATETDSVFVYGNEYNDNAEWVLETIKEDPKGDIVAFKSNNGKYLARCNNCVREPMGAIPVNTLFVHLNSSVESYAKFRLMEIKQIAP